MGFLANLLNSNRDAPDDDVAQVRSRARRRVIGAAVLLAVGVIGFPLLFETQPRPAASVLPSVVSRKDGAGDEATKIADKSAAAKVAAAPPASAAVSQASAPALQPPMMVEKSSDAGREVQAKSAATAAAAVSAVAAVTAVTAGSATKPPPKPEAKPVPKPETVATAKPAAKPAPQPEPKTTTKPEQAAAKPAATSAQRFVVQVGAFAQDAGVKEARATLERAGLRSYTQVVKTKDGKRTRVRAGPYATRDEAERAAAKAKAAGLAPVVSPLE
jgi:DedD protein